MESETPPQVVRLTEDYLDLVVGMAYPAGTVLHRLNSSQFGPEGTTLGQECLAGLFLLNGKYEVLE